ncbi:MAG TPA: nucleoside transporter C-terminal domain-containing protein [Opitutaceae bacterium]|nr:nucleoside transporter C-terminal domain-containing protein [Opitutaceae bacterium]HRJ46729.1 nucleoside transporter C-terminal domain-containing protein [Opitutaceae bacterium]
MDLIIQTFRGLLGLAVFVAIAVAFSANRRAIDWRLVGVGLVLQFVFAALVLHVGPVRWAIEGVGRFFVELLAFTRAGTGFLFGSLIDESKHGVIFAIGILPSIIFFSALTSMLYYLGILQRIVWVFAWVMTRTMKLSGAESLSASANIFLGQTEAPLLIKPYLNAMTRSEILAVMVGGMATVAGAVLIAFIAFLGGDDPQQKVLFATHLITKCVISAPAALVIAKILLPQTEPINTAMEVSRDKIGANLLDAICLGTTDGIKLAVNVGGMLIVFTAFVAMANYGLDRWIGELFGLNAWVASVTGGVFDKFSLEFILGVIFAPIAWLMGIDYGHLLQSGALLGTRTVLNEFVAFIQLSELKNSGAYTDPRTLVIMTYALAGFANIVSIGIQIGGIGAIAPGQRTNLATLGLKALLGGSLACFMAAAIAGILI